MLGEKVQTALYMSANKLTDTQTELITGIITTDSLLQWWGQKLLATQNDLSVLALTTRILHSRL